MLLLPHHYEFGETLANLPFFYKTMASATSEVMHVVQKNSNYLPEMVNGGQLREILLGGELDEHIEFVDAYEDVCDTEESENEWDISDVWLGSL